MTPRVSIVINTLNRADSLRRTLHSLRQLDYPEFEVVVIVGPSTDHTDAVVSEFGDEIKVGRCDEANLSASRNIGIRLSSGELVAFIDDDAVPDPWWLDDIVPAFQDSEVAAAGGPAYDFDGASLFSLYCLIDIHGDILFWTDGPNPSRVLAAPMSNLVATPIGTNSIFRRTALVDSGGFDEEFRYGFEESDLARRLIDGGWVVEACERGFVYHFRLPSAMRTPERVTRDMYPFLRSRAYFAVRHGRPRVGLREVVKRYEQAVERFRSDYRWCVDAGLLETEDLESFDKDAIRAADDGIESALRERRLRGRSWFDADSVFRPFHRRIPARRLHVCIVTQEYLPKQLNGIGRLSHELGLALVQRGHVVRILTEAAEHDSVELDNGVWVHRVMARPSSPLQGADAMPRHWSIENGVWVHRVAEHPASPLQGADAPPRIWNFSTSVLRELRRINDSHAVDIVQMPNWNSEGIAVLEEGGFISILGLHTSLATVARIDPRLDPRHREVRQLLALERRCYERANGFLACGPASLHQVEQEYGVTLPPNRIGYVPFGIPSRRNPSPLSVPGHINVLFVGRLEARKGIDTFLEAAAIILREIPGIAFTIVGNDKIVGETGRTYREEFERATELSTREGRVFFHGVVPDEELDRLYAGCDVFVAPSRSESFGLILLEAMREAKPVIAGDVGGMSEVVEHEGNGLLVPPGNAVALADAIRRLVTSKSLRERFGRRSWELFEERFTAARMAEVYERFCVQLLDVAVPR